MVGFTFVKVNPQNRGVFIFWVFFLVEFYGLEL